MIALLTDFGTADYFSGAMKGAILSVDPDLSIVDISHDIEAQNISEGAFCLGSCYMDFPAETVFAAVVDPGVGSSRKGIAAKAGGRFFTAPDNGLLSYVFEENKGAEVYELTETAYFADRISSTFHGRDIFAPVAAHMAIGIHPREFGPLLQAPVMLEQGSPVRMGTEIRGSIIHIDRYGNLITNISEKPGTRIRTLKICGLEIRKRARYFSEASACEPFFTEGSTGTLEICVFLGSAADITGAMVGESVVATL